MSRFTEEIQEATDEYLAAMGKYQECMAARDNLVALVKHQYQTPHVREKIYRDIITYVVERLDDEEALRGISLPH